MWRINEVPLLFPIAPSGFWKQIKIIIEDAIAEKLSQQKIYQPSSNLPEKALLKPQMFVPYSGSPNQRFMNG
jgi:hypothetical protein